VLVPIKLSYDINQMKYDERTGEPILDAVPRVMGDMDRCALEAALQLKESLGAVVEFISIGNRDTHTKLMMDAYAMGCDRGYLVEAEDANTLDAYTISSIIGKFVEKYGPYDIIIMGATSQDTHSSVVPPALSAILGYKAAFGVDKVVADGDVFILEATYEDGIYRYRLTPPFILSVTTEANTPRIPKLKDILKAKRMKYEVLPVNDLIGEDGARRITVTSIKKYVTPRRKEIIEVESDEDIDKAVDRIIELLKEAEIL